MKRILLGLAFLSLTGLAYAQKKLAYEKVPSLVDEAKKKGDVKLADSLAQDYINNYLFKLKKEEFYSKENLTFIGDFLSDENSKAFKFFMKEPEKINSVLGDYKAQSKLMDFINKKYLPQGEFEKISKTDWDRLEKTVVAKFGRVGQEIVWGQRMVCHLILKDDWQSFTKYYVQYFEIGLKHPRYNINNMSWYGIFEQVDDPKVLKFACDVVMKYAMEQWYQNDFAAYDTYANLLYKIGRKNEAIDWEEKAVKLSNNDKTILDTLEKMKNNQKTWPEAVNNR